MKRVLLAVAAAVFAGSRLLGASIVGAEYYWGQVDPGQGNATPLAIPLDKQGPAVDYQPQLDTAGMGPGWYWVTVRVRDDEGRWSATASRWFHVQGPAPVPGSNRIVAFEWFIDTEPGVGRGTRVDLPAPVDLLDDQFDLAVPETVPEGTHKLYVRALDEAGLWSFYSQAPFTVRNVKLPVITQDPQAVTVYPEAAVRFTVTAHDENDPVLALTYQWLKAGRVIDGATGSSYDIASAAYAHAGSYGCRVSNGMVEKLSQAAALTVQEPPAPTIGQHPADLTVNPGESAQFRVEASDPRYTLTYQWLKGEAEIEGATADRYTIPAAQQSDEGRYSCRVSNPYTAARSNAAALAVNDPPEVTSQPTPAAITVIKGNAAEFTGLTASGGGLTYQWYLNDQPFAGATSQLLSFSSADDQHHGTWKCLITNGAGRAWSDPVTLRLLFTKEQKDQAVAEALARYPGPDSDGDGFTDTQETELGTDPRRYVLTLTPGWNLVSLARVPIARSVAAIFHDLPIRGPVWYWDGVAYQTAELLEPLRGYWVYLDQPGAVELEILLP